MDLNQLNRFFNPWKRRIMSMVRRLTVAGSTDTFGLMQLQIETLKDVTQDNVERVQNYGFTSRPKVGAEGVVLYLGGNSDHGVVIAVDDARYRLKALAEGEVALYTDEGDKIHFKRGNKIEITTHTLDINATTEVKVTTAKATVTASGDVEVTAANAKVTANVKAEITAPTVDITAPTGVNMTTPNLVVTGLIACAGLGAGTPPAAGKAKVAGDLEVTGNVKDSVGTMAAMRATYNGHTHPGVTAGPSNTGATPSTM